MNGTRIKLTRLRRVFLVTFCLPKKHTTPDSYRGTNRLLDFVAPPTPSPAELAVRTFRGQPSRRWIEIFFQNQIRTNPINPLNRRSSLQIGRAHV